MGAFCFLYASKSSEFSECLDMIWPVNKGKRFLSHPVFRLMNLILCLSCISEGKVLHTLEGMMEEPYLG